jgi:hypothetical protein
VALGGSRHRAVVARLVLALRRVVTADQLIEDVWDGRPPPHCEQGVAEVPVDEATALRHLAVAISALDDLRARMAAPSFETAFARGADRTVSDAVDFALDIAS